MLLCVRLVDSLTGDVLTPSSWRAGDTVALVRGADVALECARDGTWRGCGLLPRGELLPDYPDVPGSRVDRFPPLLYIPAVVAQGAGGGQALSLRIIASLSLLGFGMLLALPWTVGPRGRGLHRHRHLWALLILASPLLPYAGSTWSEVPGAALLALAVALVAIDAPVLPVVVVVLLAGLSKDTAPPFLIALAFAVAQPVPGERRWFPASRAFRAAALASIGAIGLTAALNEFRYSSLMNVTYLAPTFQVRRPAAVAGHGFALLMSPNGGLLTFWPATIVLAALAGLGWRRATKDVRLRLAVVGLASGGFLLSLAMWWAPFGWQAWSPRLTLPMVPAVAVAVLVLVPPGLRPGRALLLAAGVATVLALPQAGITGRSPAIGRFMTAPRPACPPSEEVEADFVRCNLDRAWRQQPWLLVEGGRGLTQPFAATLAAAMVIGGLALAGCWNLETQAQRREGNHAPGSPGTTAAEPSSTTRTSATEGGARLRRGDIGSSPPRRGRG